MPYPFLIEENSAVGKTLYHVRVRDLDTADTHLIYGAFTPTTGSSYFRLGNISFAKVDVKAFWFNS